MRTETCMTRLSALELDTRLEQAEENRGGLAMRHRELHAPEISAGHPSVLEECAVDVGAVEVGVAECAAFTVRHRHACPF